MRSLKQFLFQQTSATGFGLMRIAWALTTLAYYIPKLPDAVQYYSGAGILPIGSEALWQAPYRHTILAYVTEPRAVLLLYLLFLLSTFYMLLGIFPRTTTILSVLLLFSFQERNSLILGGGDTVLRNVGFLLMLTPGTNAFSLRRAHEQWKHWRTHRMLLPPLQMTIWPRRLLLWQLIVIYLTSLWSKLTGTMWISGSAVGITLHHPHFARFSTEVTRIFQILSPLFSRVTLLFEASWSLLLIPRASYGTLFSFTREQCKRALLIAGFLFHGMIFTLYDVGSFSIAMFTAYCGLLDGDDFDAVRRLFGKRRKILVLFDGHCGLCQRSMFTFKLLDWLHRLEPVDFQNPVLRKKFAPDISYEKLDRAMHVRFRGKNNWTLTGFDSFRALTWHLPPLWPIAPFLYLPGVSVIGKKNYTRIAARRKKCTHEGCGV